MSKFVYPRNLSEKHPVICRIGIFERSNSLVDANIKDAAKSVANVSRQTASTTPIHQIYLYTPSAITFADGLAYENIDFTNAVGSALSAAQSASEGKDIGLVDTLKGYFGAMAADKAGSGTLEANAAAVLAIGNGQTKNPRTQMLFKAPALRQLSLTWKLMASNQQESAVIEGLIQTMRAHAYPELIANGSTFVFPDIFKVDFVTKGGGKAKMINFSNAYCTSVSVNYGASGPSFFPDGSPVEIDFTMSFQETTTLDRARIKRGF
jgi:hypothetical protein